MQECIKQANKESEFENLTISHLLKRACSLFSDKKALSCNGEKLSYSQLQQQTIYFTNYLRSQGLKKGDTIALMMPNIIAYPIAIFAAFNLGLKVVNVNPSYTTPELEKVVSDCKPDTIIVFTPVLPTVKNIISIEPSLTIIRVDPTALSGNKSEEFSECEVSFEQALKLGKETKQEVEYTIQAEAEDVAFLQYTGGTTGTPKAAILSHKNIISGIEQFQQMMTFMKQGEEVVLAPLPFYHIFGLVVTLLSSLSLGSHVVLISDPRDINNMADTLRKWPVSIIYGVSALYMGLYHMGKLEKEDLLDLKMCASGATALSKNIADKWHALTGCPITEGYGMTETAGLISLQSDNTSTIFGMVGKQLPNSQISIRDEKDNPVEVSSAGELCVKGPQVMSAYYNNPEETAKAFTTDGFFRTGDIARIDEKGNIWIVDRVKDMINVSGFNVYPNEVEQVINSFDGVLESGCIAMKSEKSGELVHAFIVLRDGCELDANQLIDHCKKKLTPYKIPKKVSFVNCLPKSPVGKVLRRKLKDLHV